MTENGGIWVGLLDIDDAGSVVGVSDPVNVEHRVARVLIRMHRAPLGYVCVPTFPVETLTARVRTAAETTLAEALRRHGDWDDSACEPGGSLGWMARASCPRRFAN